MYVFNINVTCTVHLISIPACTVHVPCICTVHQTSTPASIMYCTYVPYTKYLYLHQSFKQFLINLLFAWHLGNHVESKTYTTTPNYLLIHHMLSCSIYAKQYGNTGYHLLKNRKNFNKTNHSSQTLLVYNVYSVHSDSMCPYVYSDSMAQKLTSFRCNTPLHFHTEFKGVNSRAQNYSTQN